MIYLTSDLHGDLTLSGFTEYLERATDADTLIILGDTELSFRDTPENRAFTEEFLAIEKNIAIIDGNHENHPFLRSFPVEEKWGAPVYRLSPYIVCLQRGYIYEIEGKRLFIMGGCKSSDRWREWGLLYPFEEPSDEELARAYASLDEAGGRVDFVLTHKYNKHRPEEYDDSLVHKLMRLEEYIDNNVEYKHWYYGHGHRNLEIDDRHTMVYDRLVKL